MIMIILSQLSGWLWRPCARLSDFLAEQVERKRMEQFAAIHAQAGPRPALSAD